MHSMRLTVASMLRSVAVSLRWNRCVKAPNALMSPFLGIVALVRGKVTRFDVLALISLLRAIYRLGRAQGLRGIAIYLKACSMYLMKYMAGEPFHNCSAYGPTVSLTAGGIPRIIPPAWRDALRRGDYVIVRVLLSVFGLYRVLGYKGVFSVKTITAPWGGYLPSDLISFVPRFVAKWMKFDFKDLEWWPIPLLSKGAHSHNSVWGAGAQKLLFPKGGGGPSSQGQLMTALVSLFKSPSWPVFKEFAALCSMSWVTRSITILYLTLGDLLFGDENTKWGNKQGPVDCYEMLGVHHIGRLATKDEPGKVRVFAMVDAFTQWILYPLHKRLMGWLMTLPEDGTFNQGAAVNSARAEIGERPVWSFDLSAATDRLPVVLQVMILNHLLPGFGTSWARLLTERDYGLPRSAQKGRGSVVRYAVGQPMGAYSSWAMLAVTHHLIVQFASWRAGGGGALVWFTKYRVLGDDIIIWDKRTAASYLEIMRSLDVTINLAKTLSSSNGSFEFAKRFIYRGVDCTPVPLAALSAVGLSLDVLAEILRWFKGTRLAVALRILGFGYRVRGSVWRFRTGMSRSSYARLFLLQPGLTRDSFSSWAEWFTFCLPGSSVMEILGNLAEFAFSQLPIMPTEVPFFFIEAYAAELADGWTEEASSWDTSGQRHSGFAFRSSVEASLAALFHGMYSTLFVRERERVRATEEAFNSTSVPIRDEGIDMIVRFVETIRPTSDLISVGNVQSPGWREYRAPQEAARVALAQWIKFRLHAMRHYQRMRRRE